MSRYLIAAGLAASEVGALMMILAIIGLATGVKSWSILADILLLVGLGTWLWWRKSVVAAGLILALVVFEYSYLAYDASMSGKSNRWLSSYLILFLVAFAAHARKPKEAQDRPS